MPSTYLVRTSTFIYEFVTPLMTTIANTTTKDMFYTSLTNSLTGISYIYNLLTRPNPNMKPQHVIFWETTLHIDFPLKSLYQALRTPTWFSRNLSH